MPLLTDSKQYPEAGCPKVVKKLFWMSSGTTFADFANASEELAVTLCSPRVAVERPTHDLRVDDLPHVLVVSYQHHDADLGDFPHLDPGLDGDIVEFAVSYAVIDAFLQLGMSTPRLIEGSRMSIPEQPVVLETVWKLYDGDTYADVLQNVPALREMLGCQWLRPFHGPNSLYAGMIIGADPASTVMRDPDMRKKLAEIDDAYKRDRPAPAADGPSDGEPEPADRTRGPGTGRLEP